MHKSIAWFFPCPFQFWSVFLQTRINHPFYEIWNGWHILCGIFYFKFTGIYWVDLKLEVTNVVWLYGVDTPECLVESHSEWFPFYTYMFNPSNKICFRYIWKNSAKCGTQSVPIRIQNFLGRPDIKSYVDVVTDLFYIVITLLVCVTRMSFKSPEWTKWPIAICFHPSSCVLQRTLSVIRHALTF